WASGLVVMFLATTSPETRGKTVPKLADKQSRGSRITVPRLADKQSRGSRINRWTIPRLADN
ncbi:hypothetical protein L9F63_004445, partial [Diploptera punctata]